MGSLLARASATAAACALAISAAPASAASTAPIVRLAGTGAAGAFVPAQGSSSPLASADGIAGGRNSSLDQTGDGFVFTDKTDNRLFSVSPTGTLAVLAGDGTSDAPS